MCLSQRDRGWVVSCGDIRARIGDTNGVRYLAELRSPGVERHALDLVDRVEGVAPPGPGGVDRRRLGDADEQVDAKARTAYRHRMEALRSEIDEAMAAGAMDRAEALRPSSTNWSTSWPPPSAWAGGAGRAASAAERARVNVRRALRAAASRLAEVVPEDAVLLDKRLRTGTCCAYEPDEADEVRWVVQS